MKTLQELEIIRKKTLDRINARNESNRIRIIVGMGTCGMAAGAEPVLNTLVSEVEQRGLNNVEVTYAGCIGTCRLEPIVDVYVEGKKKVTYIKMTPEKALDVIDQHIIAGNECTQYEENTQNEEDFFERQRRIALRNCGIINPEKIDEYLAMDGYKALEKVLFSMKPEEVIDTIKKSGLRGRGGAGFATGLKWQFTSQAENEQKYVACNADEGDPGAFMDRSVLEGDPFAVLEAMTIAGFAIGSNQGYIYVRAEYPTAVKRLNIAIKQAKEYGLLGQHIFGTDFSFDIELRLGAGAYVCGEETALLNSVEGKRGEPRPRPPFPAVKGLWAKPTLLNNVETYANIPQIILNSGEWYASVGTEKSKGTKVFALGGKIKNTGLVEIPMGTPLREVIYDIGGGIPNGKKFKAVQTGGPSGGCIPAEIIDTPIDYESLAAAGSIMGSGAMIVMDEDNCMVDIAKFFLEFTVDESCGKCTPCRVGTKRMLEILEKITEGRGTEEDLEKLEKLAKDVKATSLCGLGQAAPNPVLSTLRYFRHEYEAHIKDKKCPAGVCKSLTEVKITPELCRSCGLCAKNCPVGAISGEKGKPYVIDQSLCTKCETCIGKCTFGAIGKK